MTYQERQTAIAAYVARKIEEDRKALLDAAKAGYNFPGLMVARSRKIATEANDLANRAVVWCSTRHVQFATIEEAIASFAK